jgi:hypothetical protein
MTEVNCGGSGKARSLRHSALYPSALGLFFIARGFVAALA